MDQHPVSKVAFGVLGPVVAWDEAGARIDLKGPRHREVLARLLAARGRVVPAATLIEDLWIEPPAGALGAVRTFVGALRTALEPARPPRSPATLLVTEGPGYALRAEEVDAWRFERALEGAAARGAPVGAGGAAGPGVTPGAGGAEQALAVLREALGLWRGPAYADFADAPWARAERARLGELRLQAVERVASLRLELGRPAEAVPDLDAHVAEHPWREEAWALLVRALHRSGRQGDAFAVLRDARTRLVEDLGLDPGASLQRVERELTGGAVDELWTRATADYDRTVASGTRARLESTVGLLRDLAVTGGLEAARAHRAAAVAAAEELGDPELTARVIGAYDVPALWSRVDDPPQAAAIVAAAERTLTALGDRAHDAARARLLATIALESRGTRARRAPEAAREAETIARRLDDPTLLAFALNAVFMQSFGRAGLARERDALGAELVELAARHGLVTFEVLGHLIRLQARCALDDLPAADAHADAADALAARHELPLVAVFTALYEALKAGTEPAYEAAAARLDGAGMPGLQEGLLGLARLSVRLRDGRPLHDDDLGPNAPWARPLVTGRTQAVPDPPHDHLLEVRWCLAAHAARKHGDERLRARAQQALTPAAHEHAAGSGVIALGPVAKFL